MFGAIIGDYIGSKYEFAPIYNKNFSLFSENNVFTDDSILTAALTEHLLYKTPLIKTFMKYTLENLDAGYGKNYALWIKELHQFTKESGQEIDEKDNYLDSWGNGCLMKNSPCVLLANNLDECLKFSKHHTSITHRHPHSFEAVEIFATACFKTLEFANQNLKNNIELSSEEKKEYFFNIIHNFGITFEVTDIYCMDGFHVDAKSTLPRVLACLWEANDFEEVMRNAVFIGGDCDTNAAIAGCAAEIIFGIDKNILEQFIAYSQFSGEKYFTVVPIVATSYLKSPNIDYFLNNKYYLENIEKILKDQKNYITKKDNL